ncbi:MAG: hypothetical protein ACR2LV_10725 [Solirubrobacteraceae bacterium]
MTWTPRISPPAAILIESNPMKESPLMKRLMWSGLLAGMGALATLASTRVAGLIWKRVFDEEPPE